jgi:hypothetical protein
MRYSAAKWILTAVVSTASLTLAATDAQACCGLFGWGSGYGYRSNYYGYYGPRWGGWYGTSYYAPVACGGCATCGPVCSPCGPCSTCTPCGGIGCAPCAGGNCAGGNCAIGGTSSLEPIPNDKWQKKNTYAEPAPGDTGSGTDGANKRTDSDSGLKGADASTNSQDGDGTDFQPVNRAGGTSAGGTSSGSSSSKEGKKGPNPQKADEGGEGARKAPTISIDEKVAWRSPPTRTRVESRAHLGNARLVRLPAYPQSEWLPADSETKIADRK